MTQSCYNDLSLKDFKKGNAWLTRELVAIAVYVSCLNSFTTVILYYCSFKCLWSLGFQESQ